MVSIRIVVLLGLVSCCCWSVGANVIPTPAPVVSDTIAPSNVVNEPTLAPAAISHPAAIHATVAPEVPKEPAGNHVVVPLSTHAPAAAAAAAIVPSHSPAPVKEHTVEPQAKHLLPVTTVAPHNGGVVSSEKVATVTVHTTVPPTVAVAPVHVSNEVCTGFCDYIKPICESLANISDKQMFKIQTQFKQFVLKTNGQMSLCFVEHYGLDPTFKAVSHDDLKNICASRKKLDGAKGSFQAFQTCAGNHWDPELDKDLAIIKEARVNSTSHLHPKSDKVAANIEHEEEELSMISEVVNKVLGQGGKLNETNSDVKVIDVSGKTTVAPVVPIVAGSTGAAALPHKPTTSPHNSLLNDPNNTVMVFVDDKTTAAPSHAAHVNSTVHILATTTGKPAVNSTVHHSTIKPVLNATIHLSTIKPAVNATVHLTTIKPAVNSTVHLTTIKPAVNITVHVSTLKPASNSSVHILSGTTVKPAANTTTSHVVVEKITSTNSTTPLPAVSTKAPAINGTTSKPIKANGTSVAPTTLKPTVKVASTTVAPVETSTRSPVTTSAPSSTPAPTKAATAETSVEVTITSTTVKPTLRPIDTLEQILHRQENEKLALDNKLKAERNKAISQLKKKDGAPSHAADAKIHQMEHERQMTIDPIGHTIKHQQYEAKKQEKSSTPK